MNFNRLLTTGLLALLLLAPFTPAAYGQEVRRRPVPDLGGGGGGGSFSPHSIIWANLTDATVGGGNVYLATGGGAYANGGSSSEACSGNCEITLTTTNAAVERLFGLGSTGTGGGFARINHCIDLSSNTIVVFESGGSPGSFGTFITGDVISIVRTGTTVTYRKNGSTFYTSLVSSSGAVYVNGLTSGSGVSLENIVLADGF